MSTRGAIARMTHVLPLHWAGRYHHWDSYPTGLGKELWELFHGHFERDLDRMLRVLINEHPAGWSTITGADFRLTPGWGEAPNDDVTSVENPGCRPNCYCHGERSEEAWLVTDDNASGSGVEWAYVFTSVLALDDGQEEEHLCTMLVLSSYFASGEKMIGMFGMGDPKAHWRIAAVIDLQGSEPDWERIESGKPVACGSQPNNAQAPASVRPGVPPTRVALDEGRPHLYQVDVPSQAHHYVGFGRDVNGAEEVFCTCSPEEETPSPDCIHAQAVSKHRKEKREAAQARQKRGLIYSGQRVRIGTELDGDRTAPMVLVSEGEQSSLLDPKPSQKLRNHSPSGFEWGYAGSGPAQLALALLLDCMGDEQIALRHYQAFKVGHISPLPNDEAWRLTGEEIETFCRNQERHNIDKPSQ